MHYRSDGGVTCNIFWPMSASKGDIINEQTAFTFYSFLCGFLTPLGFILIFYVLVIS